MNARPTLLDLFCGAGGSSVGFHRAGFNVTGVDVAPQPHYPFTFIQADALSVDLDGYDVIAASPPCQGYSRMRHLPWLAGRTWPLLIPQVRARLRASGAHWVIENVEGSPLQGVTLCGQSFGLRVYRHRCFESNLLLLAPAHQRHAQVIGAGRRLNDRARPNGAGFVSLAGHMGSRHVHGRALDIDWMTREELAQAIPPAYTAWIGAQLMTALAHTPQVAS